MKSEDQNPYTGVDEGPQDFELQCPVHAFFSHKNIECLEKDNYWQVIDTIFFKSMTDLSEWSDLHMTYSFCHSYSNANLTIFLKLKGFIIWMWLLRSCKEVLGYDLLMEQTWRSDHFSLLPFLKSPRLSNHYSTSIWKYLPKCNHIYLFIYLIYA